MIKDLHIPVESTETVDLAAITPSYKGIILGCKDDNHIGYIQYYDGEWYFMNGSDFESSVVSEESLFTLVGTLVSKRICSSFKVVEFS